MFDPARREVPDSRLHQGEVAGEEDGLFSDIVHSLFRDSNVPLLFERHNRGGLLRAGGPLRRSARRSSVDLYTEVAQIAWRAFSEQRSHPLDVVVNPFTPHGLHSYVTARVLELMGVAYLVAHRTFSGGYKKLLLGIGRDAVPLQLDLEHPLGFGPSYDLAIAERISTANASYSVAIPEAERKRQAETGGAIFSLKRIINAHARDIAALVNALQCWKELNSVSRPSSDFDGQSFVLYFLNYQPEATSLPEGNEFAVQFNAVLELRRATPHSIPVLVREHPATYTLRCDPRWRWPGFYSAIAKTNGVHIVNIHEDPFYLVDRAAAVATLTGTVAFEAAARGTPSIFMGVPYLPGSAGVHHYRGFGSLRTFIENALNHTTADQVQADLETSLRRDAPFVFPAVEPVRFPNNKAVIVDALRAIARSESATSRLRELKAAREARGGLA